MTLCLLDCLQKAHICCMSRCYITVNYKLVYLELRYPLIPLCQAWEFKMYA